MKQYLWVILTGILLALFYAGLPEINEKTAIKGKLGRLTGKDLILMAVITVIFAFVDFWNLGNTNSPETFADLSGRTAEISFSESVKPDTITYFSGTGTGTCSCTCSCTRSCTRSCLSAARLSAGTCCSCSSSRMGSYSRVYSKGCFRKQGYGYALLPYGSIRNHSCSSRKQHLSLLRIPRKTGT